MGGTYLILLALVAAAVHQFRPKLPPALPTNESALQPSGLRGWLILPAIGLIVSPIRTFCSLAGTFSVYAPDSWHTLTDPSGTAYNGLWAPTLIYEFLTNLTVIVFAILLLLLFFQRRPTFPALYIAFLAFCTITATLDTFLVQLIPAVASKTAGFDKVLMQDYFSCLVWIPYMLISKRVKSTFLR